MADKNVSWTFELVEQFIVLYEGYPCLQNTTDKYYCDRDKKRKALNEIATTIEMTGTVFPRMVTVVTKNFTYPETAGTKRGHIQFEGEHNDNCPVRSCAHACM